MVLTQRPAGSVLLTVRSQQNLAKKKSQAPGKEVPFLVMKESSAADWEYIIEQLHNEDKSPAYDKKQTPKEDLNGATQPKQQPNHLGKLALEQHPGQVKVQQDFKGHRKDSAGSMT